MGARDEGKYRNEELEGEHDGRLDETERAALRGDESRKCIKIMQ